MKSNSIIILAAGDGTRMKSSIPKIFHKIGGASLLDHVIKSAKGINPEKIVVVTQPTHPIKDLIYGEYVTFVYQEYPRGTGDAVKCALENVNCETDGWIYILYADIPLISTDTLQKWMKTANNSPNIDIVILAMNTDDSSALGKLEKSEEYGTIKSIVEAKDAEQFNSCPNCKAQLLPLCNAGLLIRKNILSKLIKEISPSKTTGEIYITSIVGLAYHHGYKCTYYEGNSNELSGVNTRSDLAKIEKQFQENMRNKHMNNGVTLISPETVFFSHDTIIENDVTVHPYTIFSTNVTIKRGSVVGPFCVIEGCEVNNAQIGPFSRIRPKTEIHSGVKIGNFVEIKNSTISDNSKVNHLSYIGDSYIGTNSNIGAGTITCNYNGFIKQKTYIGNNTFIGSNTAIVAPVHIHDNAIIGAGSVITKNVKDGDLAISRSPQVNREKGAIHFREINNKKKEESCAE